MHRKIFRNKLHPLVEIGRVNDQSRVGPRRDRHPDIQIDRHRQHEAIVVVGLLADQVDPAGGAENSRLVPEERPKFLTQLESTRRERVWRPLVHDARRFKPKKSITRPKAKRTTPQARLTLMPSETR